MGLIANQGSTLVAPQGAGLIDPRTGKPVGSDRSVFRQSQR